MGRNCDTERHVGKTGENGGGVGLSNPGREACDWEKRENGSEDGHKRLSVEETFRRFVERSPWEGPEDFVSDPNQKGPVTLPPWFQADVFADGQRYYGDNVFCMLGAKMAGLVALLRVDTIANFLYRTERSDTDVKALRRYVATLKEMNVWYKEEPTAQGSWAESLLDVRRRHARAVIASQERERVKCARPGDDVDASPKKPPMSQFDLVLTQFAFCGVALLRANEIGLQPNPKDIRGFLHFWRLIGSLMGISDRYNLCNEDSDPDYCLRLLDLVRGKVFLPLLNEPHTEVSAVLTKGLLEGMWCMMPLLELDSFQYLTKELFADLGDKPSKPRLEDLRPTALFIRHLFHWITWSLYLPAVGPWLRSYHNGSVRFGMYMIQNYPLLAWWKYGLSYKPNSG